LKNIINFLRSKTNSSLFLEKHILNKHILNKKKVFIDLCSEKSSLIKFIQKKTKLDIIANDISSCSKVIFKKEQKIETLLCQEQIEDSIIKIYKDFIGSNFYKKSETIVYIDPQIISINSKNNDKILSRNNLLNSFEDIVLLSLTISNNVFISYNNEGILKEEDIKHILKKVQNYNHIKLNTYKNDNKYFNNKFTEIIWHIENLL